MYEYKTTPFKHQKDFFMSFRDVKSHAVFWEAGCGKSKICIDTASYLFEKNEINSVVIIAPNGVHMNWSSDEIPTHLPDRLIPKLKELVWDSKKANNKSYKDNLDVLITHDGFSWFYINYDAVITKNGLEYLTKFLKNRKCLYILDESHNIKNPSAQRTKKILSTSNLAPYKRILTGTPVAKGPFDVFSQIQFVDGHFWQKYGLGSYFVFKQYFGNWLTRQQSLKTTGYDPGYDRLLSYKNVAHLNILLKDLSSRLTKDEAGLDIPDKIYTKCYYNMNDAEKKIYKALRDEFNVELENGFSIDASLALVRLLRLQQVVCGYLPSNDDNVLSDISEKNTRLEKLIEVLENHDVPTIIWARFTRDIDLIMERLGADAVRYDGVISSEQAFINKKRFQNNEVKYFVAKPQKGSEGLTLVNAKHVVYYSNSFRLIDRLQSEDRCHRIGQSSSVLYSDIVAIDTIDSHLIDCLRKNNDISRIITGDKFKEWI